MILSKRVRKMNERLKLINNHMAYLKTRERNNTSVVKVLLTDWNVEKKYIEDHLPKNHKLSLESKILHEQDFRFGGVM